MNEQTTDNKKIIAEYRRQLMSVHGATVSIVSFAEIIAYIIFIILGIHTFSLRSAYLWEGVVAPILINLIAHMAVRYINASDKTSEELKNASVIYGAFVTTFVVSLFHRDYIVGLCAFVFPIILSAMYSDKKLLRQSLWMALFSLTTTTVVLFFEHKVTLRTSLNIMMLYGYIAVSFLSALLSIKFSQRNFSVITEHILTNSDLKSQITLDQMTGLYNHKAFYKKLESVIEEKKDGTECCLAMVDVDDFKKVNDTYGHDSGDRVLVLLADTLKKYCDADDYPCRYGGEEFAVIFTNKSLKEAELQMTKVLQSFRGYKFEFTNSSITFSCGLVHLKKEDTAEQFFNRADYCLYEAKKAGKNRITTDK